MRRRSELTIDEKIEIADKYVLDKCSLDFLAREYHRSITTIVQILDEMHVSRRSHKVELDDNEVIRLYTEEMMTLEDIGRLMGCSDQTIRRRLNKHGIKRRTRADYLKAREVEAKTEKVE